MNSKIEGAYFFAWGQLRRLMRSQGVPSKECDAERRKIHAQVTGSDKSHSDFTKDETDDVIARFRYLAGVIKQTDFKRGRRLYVIRQLCASMDKGESYAQGIADQMDSEGRLSSGPIRRLPGQTRGEHEMAKWDAELQRGPVFRRLLHELQPEELDKVIVALREHEKAGCLDVATSASLDVRPSFPEVHSA
jgi:hypothetical protein